MLRISELEQSGIGPEQLRQLGLPTTDAGLQGMNSTLQQALCLLLCYDPKVLACHTAAICFTSSFRELLVPFIALGHQGGNSCVCFCRFAP
jgi:hypothetical protein